MILMSIYFQSFYCTYTGQQMEEKGIEWVCPICLKKKAEGEKTKPNSQNPSGKPRLKTDQTDDATTSQAIVPSKEILTSGTDPSAVPISGTTQCVVCKKEARNSSIYCSDACILAHAQETLTKDKPVPTGSNTKPMKTSVAEIAKTKPEARVIVFDRKTGKVLTGK